MTQTRYTHITTFPVTAGPFWAKFMVGNQAPISLTAKMIVPVLCATGFCSLGNPVGATSMASPPWPGKIKAILEGRGGNIPVKLSPGKTEHWGETVLELCMEENWYCTYLLPGNITCTLRKQTACHCVWSLESCTHTTCRNMGTPGLCLGKSLKGAGSKAKLLPWVSA